MKEGRYWLTFALGSWWELCRARLLKVWGHRVNKLKREVYMIRQGSKGSNIVPYLCL